MTPAEWFDQFPPPPPGTNWPAESAWCPRHWAPCPHLHANGISAEAALRQLWLRELAPHGSYSAATRNRQYAAAGRICCLLGDDRMHELWAPWLPAQTQEAT